MRGTRPETGLEALLEEQFCAAWTDVAFVDLLCNNKCHITGQ